MIVGHRLVLLPLDPKPEGITPKLVPIEVTVLTESKTTTIGGVEYTHEELKERFKFITGSTILRKA